MADNLVFPIGFDLEEAVKKAGQEWNSTYADKLEKLLAKRAITVNLGFSTKNLNNLDDVKRRLAELKIEPLTPENKTAIKDLVRELKELAKAMEKVQKYSKIQTPELQQALANKANAEAAHMAEKYRQANERLEVSKRRVALAEQKHAEALSNTSKKINEQHSYVSRLIKRMAVYASFSYAGNFLTSIREVTAEFELQRVSLGAIIQDQQLANQLFAEIKSFALTSPLKILDLTKYTKQVAAYGFEANKLFDTTKMLADISVGLGVDMSRLTLFLGQVYATGYLRASEVRQATEAGIPLVDKLAKKLSEANGRLVTAADVMDLISKRAISFEQVEDVFKDMTSAGGEFYNMQVKQSQTLFGMWSKLGDAAAIMYDQIGNTSSVNAGMKLAISSIESMMRNWKTMARVLDSVAVALTVYVVGLKNAAVASKSLTAIESLALLTTKQRIIATPKLVAAIIGQSTATKLSTNLTNAHTFAMMRAATATNVLSKSFWKLTAAMLANPWVAAASAIALVGVALFHFIGNTETAAERAEKLNESVAALKNTESTTKPLVEAYTDLSNKTERTVEEQKKLSNITQELAKRFPEAVVGVNKFNNEISISIGKVQKLAGLMRDVSEKNVRNNLEKSEADLEMLQNLLVKYDKFLKRGGGSFYDADKGETVFGFWLSESDKKKIVARMAEITGQIETLNNDIINTKRELGDLPSEEVEAIEKFGAWKKKLTEFSKDVGGIKVRLFDDSTIDQFGTLEEALEAVAKQYKDAVESVETNNKTLERGVAGLGQEQFDRITAERDEAQAMKELSEEALNYYNAMALLLKVMGGRGGKSDPRLSILQEMASTLKQVNKEYDELAKKEGATKALADTQDKYANTFKYLQSLATKYKFELPDFGVPTDAASLTKYLDAVKEAMKKLPESEKVVLSLETDIADINMTDAQKKIEAELKRLSDRISRTKTAKEFYEKILGMTGDVELAANLSLSIYGENGEDLDKAIRDNIQATLGKNKEGIDLDFSAAIRTDGSVDYNALTKIAKEYLDMGEISEETYNKILKMRDEDRKDLAKTVEGWMKATGKAKTYSDKLLDLRRRTQTEIDSINEKEARGEISPEFAESQRAGFLRKEAEEVAKLQYEAFKDSPMYVQIFDDLEHASTTMLSAMRDRLLALKGEWKNLDPTQLKEMQSRLREIDAQLTSRNPFKALVAGIKQYRKLRTKGDALGSKSSGEADKKLLELTAKRIEAEKEYLTLLNDEKATKEQIADAKDKFDQAQSDEQGAQKAKEVWQDVNITIGSATDTILVGLGAIGDIANGVADIMEAVGADEEDVAYWRTIGDSIGEITAGLQDIVQSVMKGDLMGVITGVITAVPKMFVGFVNIFSAGKVRKANKEIKRQQELLEQLEYTYGRLEKAADKVFGADFVSNQKQQQKILLAQQQAYMKQYEAEMSKGKKADEEKAQEFLDKARDIGDQIADMEGKIAERMLGTDLTSAARDFAKAWLDAYKQFGNTADAMSEKFHEMIENMVVESLMAKAMQRALEPTFKMIDEMDEGDFYDENFWRKVMESADQGSKDANAAGAVIMEWAKKWGYDGREKADGFTGISKNIAGATSEEINNVAAIGNTLMYYVSPIPRIDENLARVVAIMEGRGAALPTASGVTTGAIDYTEMFTTANQHLSSLPRMEQHLAEIHTMLRRALKTKGSTTGFNTFLNS